MHDELDKRYPEGAVAKAIHTFLMLYHTLNIHRDFAYHTIMQAISLHRLPDYHGWHKPGIQIGHLPEFDVSMCSNWLRRVIDVGIMHGIFAIDAVDKMSQWVGQIHPRKRPERGFSAYDKKRITQMTSGTVIKFQVPAGARWGPGAFAGATLMEDQRLHEQGEGCSGYAVIHRCHLSDTAFEAYWRGFLPYNREETYYWDNASTGLGFQLPVAYNPFVTLDENNGQWVGQGDNLRHVFGAFIPFEWVTHEYSIDHVHKTCSSQEVPAYRRLAEQIASVK